MERQNLNLDDLKLMVQIIKVVTSRGAIQAEEMTAVGVLYNKLSKFVQSAEPNETPADEDQLVSEGN